jgi:hypothetical protein
MTPPPTIYFDGENSWTDRAAWCWWHWLDETWLGWHRWGWDSETGERLCNDPDWYYAGYYADSEVAI